MLTQAFAAQAPEPVTDDRGEPVARALIVNMLDQRVHKLTPDFMTYTMAKMGLWALTRTAAQALAPRVRVNAIGPGPDAEGRPPVRRPFRPPARRDHPRPRCRRRRISAPRLAIFLDAKAVTGQLICVDGGQHLGWQTPDILGLEG